MENTKQIKEINIKNPSTSFGYTGKIKVSVKKGNKVYLTKNFKNEGTYRLFEFLSYCLRGDYYYAEELRPKLIKVFYNQDLVGYACPKITDTSAEKLRKYFKTETSVSLSFWPYESIPDVETVIGEIGSSKITYKFTIPFTQLNLQTNPGITSFALYKSSLMGDDEPSMFFFTTELNNLGEEVVTNILENSGLNSISNDYNLYVEWTLEISNPKDKVE